VASGCPVPQNCPRGERSEGKMDRNHDDGTVAAASGRVGTADCVYGLETPLGLRKLSDWSGNREFSGFKEERSNMRRVVSLEKEVRLMKDAISGLLEKYDNLTKDNDDLKMKYAGYENALKVNSEMKKSLEELKQENKELSDKCENYEKALHEMNQKVEVSSEEVKKVESELSVMKENKDRYVEGALSGEQLEELKSVWKKECEEEKMSFREVIQQQIREKTKDTVIKVIKENEDLVRDTVDKKKCLVIFGLKEKKNPIRFIREKEDKELAKKIITAVQDEDQGLEKELEEAYRIGKYNEGGGRPLKIKMRSQVTVEEILARVGKLARSTEYKEVWIKRDMNLEEREKEKKLRNEAREKNEKRTETEKKNYYWRVIDMRLRKWYIQQREEGAVGGRPM